jgi:hypothetical protein
MEDLSWSVGGDEAKEIAAAKSKRGDLPFDSLADGKPVKRFEERSGTFPFGGAHDEPGCCILDSLEAADDFLTESG